LGIPNLDPLNVRSGEICCAAKCVALHMRRNAAAEIAALTYDCYVRSVSTISREVRRIGGRQAYRATRTDERAWDCATRPKSCKLSFNDPLCQLIAGKLRRKWSPQQIAGWLK
jgi:IS30 family transposase